MKKRWKILLVLVAVYVLAWFCLLPGGGARRKVEAYKKELIAKGEKLSLADLTPPPATNGSNAAKDFMTFMNAYSPPSDWPAMMGSLTPWVRTVLHTESTNVTPAMMLGYENNVRRMAELRGILQGGVLDFGRDYSQRTTLQLPHLLKLKQAVILSSMTSMEALNRKDSAEAFADALTTVDLTRLYEREPLIISDLVRLAMSRMALSASWEGLQSHQWTEPQLAELQSRWEGFQLFGGFEPALDLERAYGMDRMAMGRAASEPAASGVVLTLNFSSATNNNPFSKAGDQLGSFYDRHVRFRLWKSSWSYDEELFQLQIIAAGKEASAKMRQPGGLVPALNEFNLRVTNLFQLNPGAQSKFLLGMATIGSTLDRYFSRSAEGETARRLLVVAIALQRYQMREGAYPPTLQALVPEYLRQMPEDLMDGKPLRYRLQADGNFLLYSVGLDGKDDGGDPVFPATTTFKDFTFGRDIVWPRAATVQEVEAFNRLHPASTNAP